jgi:hypothetical protein
MIDLCLPISNDLIPYSELESDEIASRIWDRPYLPNHLIYELISTQYADVMTEEFMICKLPMLHIPSLATRAFITDKIFEMMDYGNREYVADKYSRNCRVSIKNITLHASLVCGKKILEHYLSESDIDYIISVYCDEIVDSKLIINRHWLFIHQKLNMRQLRKLYSYDSSFKCEIILYYYSIAKYIISDSDWYSIHKPTTVDNTVDESTYTPETWLLELINTT